jgi:hypothetical protein
MLSSCFFCVDFAEQPFQAKGALAISEIPHSFGELGIKLNAYG